MTASDELIGAIERANKLRDDIAYLIEPTQSDWDVVLLVKEIERLRAALAKREAVAEPEDVPPKYWLNPANLLAITDDQKRTSRLSRYPKFSVPCATFRQLNEKRAMLAASQQTEKNKD